MRIVRVLLLAAVLAAIGNPILLYFLQEKLLFQPLPVNEGQRAVLRRFAAVEELTLAGEGGTKLHGWYQRAAGSGKAPLILYFGGNSEDVSYLPSSADRVPGWSLAVFEYRGYGMSEGEPGEQALFADALAIHDTFARREEIDARRIVVMGRSLGTGVATYVASQRPVLAAVLVTPYDSILHVASDKFWFAPVAWILRHRFESVALAQRMRHPAFFLVAGEDEEIPPHYALALYEQWGAPKRWHVFRGEGHNTIDAAPDYWTRIADFLAYESGRAQ